MARKSIPIFATGSIPILGESFSTQNQERLYVGYKYYETRYEDTVIRAGNTSGYEYGADVALPFGYG